MPRPSLHPRLLALTIAAGWPALGGVSVATTYPRLWLVFFDREEWSPIGRWRETLADAMNPNHMWRRAPGIRVAGHTDSSEMSVSATELAMRRVTFVAEELVRLGVRPDEIDLEAVGTARPLVPAMNGVPEPQNRRVEIILGSRHALLR